MLWVGQSASPQLLLDLFGVDDIFKVDIRLVRPAYFSIFQSGGDRLTCPLTRRPLDSDGAPDFGYPSIQAGSHYTRTETQRKWRPCDKASDRATELRRS